MGGWESRVTRSRSVVKSKGVLTGFSFQAHSLLISQPRPRQRTLHKYLAIEYISGVVSDAMKGAPAGSLLTYG